MKTRFQRQHALGTVNTLIAFRYSTFICYLTICFFGVFSNAFAASWQVSNLPGRERLVVRLEKPLSGQQAARTTENELTINLGETITNTDGPVGSLITAVIPNGEILRIQLRDAAFGYVLSQPSPETLQIDIFPDPVGARWRPTPGSGSLVSAAPTPSSTTVTRQSPPPQAPASEPPQTSSQTSPQTSPPTSPQTQTNESAQPQTAAQTQPSRTTESQATPQSQDVQEAPNPATTDPRTLGSNVRSDGRGLIVTQTPVPGQTAPATTVQATSPAGAPSSSSSPPETAPPPPLPTKDDLTRMTQRIDKMPINPNQTTLPPQASQAPLAADGSTTGTSVTGRIPIQGLSGAVATPDLTQQNPPSQEPQSTQATADTPDILTQPSVSSEQPEQSSVQTIPQGRTIISGPSVQLRGRINPEGPEAWPSEFGLASPAASALEPLPEETETPEDIAQEEPSPDTPPRVVYVNEEGQEVPKPPDSAAMIEDAQTNLNTYQFQEAKNILDEVKNHTLSPEQRERVLYMLSDALFGLYTNRWVEGYEPIAISTNEAMNFNLRSPKVPDALFRLGQLNLNVGNQQDAAGYFEALKAKYPQDPSVSHGLYLLGKDQLNKQQYAEATQQFQAILDQYPESPDVRDASRYMAEALYKQGHYDRAAVLVDFVDRRWPRLYLDDPMYLGMSGDLYMKLQRYNEALQIFWTHYNLLPEDPENHRILFNIGDIYLLDNHDKGARGVYNEILQSFPKSESAPKAILRLGEMEILPTIPTLQELLAFFEKPSNSLPEAAYRRVLSEYPDSPEAVTAAFRLAAWQFRNAEIADAMQRAADFIEDNPSSPLSLQAEELIRRGFEKERALALSEENYERLLQLWERYPQVQVSEDKLDDDLRVGLARAHLNRGEEAAGMALLEPFFSRPQDPKYSEYAYNIKLAQLLRTANWDGILALGEQVASWDLPKETRSQLDYSMAISAENLGLPERALTIWESLQPRNDIPLYQKAYATYFMARDAERRKDLNAAYDYNLEALQLFTELESERSDKADPERIRESLAALMDVTEVANRFAESLDWASQYKRFVTEESPDYAGLLFREARLHRKMGDMSRWRLLLDTIIQREPDSVFGRMAASELRTQDVARDLTRFVPDTPPQE